MDDATPMSGEAVSDDALRAEVRGWLAENWRPSGQPMTGPGGAKATPNEAKDSPNETKDSPNEAKDSPNEAKDSPNETMTRPGGDAG